MANYKPLNPNASPYLQNPPHLYVCLYPHPYYNLHPPLYTYNIQFQPKSFTISLPPPPPSAKQIKISLSPVQSGPRIPKSRLRKNMKWVPKINQQGFEGRRWKNSRRGYQPVLSLEANTTSLMIKNIPNNYTRKLLIQTLDDHCEAENNNINNGEKYSAYDFVYLPIDFKRRTNAGFAFVNFTNPEAAFRFRNAFNGKRWNLFDSSKVAEISRARIQGKTALVNNCKGMDFTYGSEEDMPVWFAPARDGSGECRSKMFIVGKTSWN